MVCLFLPALRIHPRQFLCNGDKAKCEDAENLTVHVKSASLDER